MERPHETSDLEFYQLLAEKSDYDMLPFYGGLWAINKALKNNELNQEATLHVVDDQIDNGEVIATMPYSLSKTISYKKNEDIAYTAGINLLVNYLKYNYS